MPSFFRSLRGAVKKSRRDRRGATLLAMVQRQWLRIKNWRASSDPTCDVGECQPSSVSTRQVKKLCRSSYPTWDEDEHEPSWVSARQANLTCCTLYRLPDELVLQILGGLDCVSRAIARRACGLFMRIIYDGAPLSVNSYALDFLEWPPLQQPLRPLSPDDWFRQLHFRKQLSIRKEIHCLLDRDRFCDACHQFRDDGRYGRALKRLQTMLWCTYCNEAHRRPLFSPRQRDAPSTARVCILAEGRARICAHLSITWKDAQSMEPPGSSPKRFHEICQHHDHGPPRSAFQIRQPQYPRFDEYARPSLIRWRRKDSHSLDLITHTTILLAQLHHTTPVTRAWLQDRLAANEDVLGKMLCPHVTVHDGQLLLPFSSDRCACFDRLGWVDHRCTSFRSYCCRCLATENPSQVGYFMRDKQRHKHIYRCVVCDAEYGWERNGSAVYLSIHTLIGDFKLAPHSRVPRGMQKPHWLYSIHPESWGILEDDELHHVAWCDDMTCATRWRWERLYKLFQGRLGPIP